MRIVDFVISKKLLGRELRDRSFYVRIDRRDVFGSLKKLGKFPAEDMKQKLDEMLGQFQSDVNRIVEELGEKTTREKGIVAWVDEQDRICLSQRLLVDDVDDFTEKVEAVREKLIGEELWMRVSGG